MFFLFVWNIMSESPHLCLLGSHLYQTICWVVKLSGVVKEHGITTQSPASAVISLSVRVIQNPYGQYCLSLTDAPVIAIRKRKTGTEDI